jgi:hypothetical protein
VRAGHGVGSGRPPKHTQWRPGQSGNPSGRPKRPKSFDRELIDVLNQTTRIRVGNRDIEVTTLQRIVVALVKSALEGESWAISLVVAHVAKITRAAGYDDQDAALTADELEILNDQRKAYQKDESEGGAAKGADGGSSAEAESDR